MNHTLKTQLTIIALLLISSNASAFTPYSESSRQTIVSAKSKKLSNVRNIKRLSLTGSYDTDQNSKEYKLATRYFFQNYRFIGEIDFFHENEYKDRGSGSKKQYKIKSSELYDIELTGKARLFDTNNYGVLYHRTIYDDMSKYYYDNHSAIGLGRMFLNGALELDASVGYQDTKNLGYTATFIPSYRLNIKLTDKIKLTQRGFYFIDHESADNELKTSLSYKIKQGLSFELRHTFEQRRYEYNTKTKREVVNRVRNLYTIGLLFSF